MGWRLIVGYCEAYIIPSLERGSRARIRRADLAHLRQRAVAPRTRNDNSVLGLLRRSTKEKMDRMIFFALMSISLLCALCDQTAGFVLQDLPLDRSARNKERKHAESNYAFFAKRYPTLEHYNRYLTDPRLTREVLVRSFFYE